MGRPFLREVADGDELRAGDRARVGLGLAGEDPEQGRLPGAVGADEADPVAGTDRERRGADEDALAELDADVDGGDQGVTSGNI
jgi:hypothetical protein